MTDDVVCFGHIGRVSAVTVDFHYNSQHLFGVRVVRVALWEKTEK